MPNLEAAANLIADASSAVDPSDVSVLDAMNAGVSSAMGESEQPSDTPESTEPEQKAAEQNAAELRAAEMRARIDRLKSQAAERAEFKRLESLKAEVAAARAEAERAQAEAKAAREGEMARWKAALQNPIAGFKELGLEPQDAYRQITEAVLEDEKPERKQAKLVDKLLQEKLGELQPKLSKVEELEAQLKAMREAEEQRAQAAAQAETRAAELEFIKIVKSNGYALLADYYDDEELIPIGHAVANELMANGQRVTFEGVAAELHRRLEAHLKRAEERRSKRQGTPVSADSSAAKSSAGQPAPQAKTLTNQLSSSTATATTKTMSRAERLAKAEQLLHSMDKR